MRFIHPALFAFAVSASVNAKALRQYHPRSELDVCANVDAEFEIDGHVMGTLHLCICISDIPIHLVTYPVLKKAVRLHGKPAVSDKVTELISSAYDSSQCYYPEHAEPKCDENPCDFTCKDGFQPHPKREPTSCVCKKPYVVCNGVCGDFPHCGSQKPKKRDAKWRDATCPQGWSACGVWGASGRDYECVDVAHDLWSCGGCGIPLLPTDPTGIDCTAIPGVLDVSCLDSRCVVDRCRKGFTVGSDNSTCISTTGTSPNVPVFVNNGNGPFKGREAL